MLSEYSFECATIDRARIDQSLENAVAEGLLKPTISECVTPLFPIGFRLHGIGQHIEAFLSHQLVVQLVESVLP